MNKAGLGRFCQGIGRLADKRQSQVWRNRFVHCRQRQQGRGIRLTFMGEIVRWFVDGVTCLAHCFTFLTARSKYYSKFVRGHVGKIAVITNKNVIFSRRLIS